VPKCFKRIEENEKRGEKNYIKLDAREENV